MKKALVILAAGMGSRYGGLKQIDPVGPNGEVVMDYSIHDAIRAGFNKVVFVIRRDIEEAFKEKLGARYEGKVEVTYAFQELDAVPPTFARPAPRTKPWGTAHAVLVAKHEVNEPFAAINADDFYGADAYQQLAHELEHPTPNAFSMVGFRLNQTLSEHGHVSRGLCEVTPDGFLQTVTEHTHIEKQGERIISTASESESRLTGDEIVSMNMWGFTPDLFTHLDRQFEAFLSAYGQEEKSECYLPACVDELIHAKQATVHVVATSSPWFGVTYPDDKPLVIENLRRLIADGVYPRTLT